MNEPTRVDGELGGPQRVGKELTSERSYSFFWGAWSNKPVVINTLKVHEFPKNI
tara:strand:+ start:4034 stop:4195 length:162 start_codon:yes stop_codon:yes gene_type:complete